MMSQQIAIIMPVLQEDPRLMPDPLTGIIQGISILNIVNSINDQDYEKNKVPSKDFPNIEITDIELDLFLQSQMIKQFDVITMLSHQKQNQEISEFLTAYDKKFSECLNEKGYLIIAYPKVDETKKPNSSNVKLFQPPITTESKLFKQAPVVNLVNLRKKSSLLILNKIIENNVCYTKNDGAEENVD